MRRKFHTGLKTINGESVQNSEKERNTFVTSFKRYFREYCGRTSIHGIQYVGEKNRSTTEKLWWLVIFVISITMCSLLIQRTYTKWKTRPVIVTLAEIPTPIWEVPFPAVTICPATKVRQSIFNFTEIMMQLMNNGFHDIPYEKVLKFEAASLICERHFFPVGNETIDKNTTDFIKEVGPDPETISWCGFNNGVKSCSKIFHPILTEEGLCYTFNMFDSSELFIGEEQISYNLKHNISSNWSLDEGYTNKEKLKMFPRRSLRSGMKAGLSVLLKLAENDMDYICSLMFQGYKIILHNPAEIPRVSEQYILAPLNQAVIVAVKPNMITTSNSLRNYDPSVRHCYFPHEKPLQFFKVYTQKHCEIECLRNFILAVCGCVPYHMPHTNSTLICGYGNVDCYTSPEQMTKRSVLRRLGKSFESFYKKVDYNTCIKKCLPACTSLTYNVEVSQTDINIKRVVGVILKNQSDFHWTQVDIFFKESEFTPLRKNELYGLSDFIANCGGLLGLFMGFSFLSFVEILYFLTLRMWCNIKGHRKKINDNAMNCLEEKDQDKLV